MSAWHRGAAAFIVLLACGFFAPAALAGPSPQPATALHPVAFAADAEMPAPAAAGTRATAPSAAVTADPEAGAVATTASPAGPSKESQPVLAAQDGQTDSAAPADTATPDATSTTGQSAGSTATATQQQPINVVVIVRIDSPGNDGPITQSNISVASSTAANDASTAQGGLADAVSSTTQQATPTATATQDSAGNLVITVRLDSPGKNGAVTQTNGVLGGSTATNTSDTAQQVAAPTPAVQPQARRAGAAASPKPPQPRHRRPAATMRTPTESSGAQAATTDAEPAATTPHRAAPQKPAPSHRHPAVAQNSRGRTNHPSTLSSITKGAVQALSPFVPTTSPAADATRSQDITSPVLLTLLLSAAAAATFALVRRTPARRRAASWRAPR